MSYLRYLFTILLTLTMFYGWASPSVATSQFVCRGVGLTEPERSSLWNLSDVSTLDKAGLNLAPRYVATSVHDGDSVRTIISEIIDGRRMRYLVDGSNLIWIGEETPEMHIRVDTLCYTSALLPFGDVSIPLSLHYRSNVIRSDDALVQSATYYPYGEPHRAPKNLTAAIGFWNDLSGQYTMDGYTVNFALTYHEVEPLTTSEGKVANQSGSIRNAMLEDRVGNLYMTVSKISGDPNSGSNENITAGAYGSRAISISKTNAVELTGAHEVGHSLGLQHSDKGIMYPFGDDGKRTKIVSEDDIKLMLKNAMTGVVAKDDKGNEAGKGHLDNKAEIEAKEWKYEVEKRH